MPQESEKMPQEVGEEQKDETRTRLSTAAQLRKPHKEKSGKRMNKGVLVGLLLLAVVLVGAATFFVTRWKPAQEEAIIPKDESIHLTQYAEADVTSVSIALTGAQPYTVQRTLAADKAVYSVQGWGADIKLKLSSVRDVYAAACSLQASILVEENPADLTIYGLDKPQSTMTVRLAQGGERVFLLGNHLPAGSGYYLMEQGGAAVYTTTTYAAERMQRAQADLRDASILPVIDPMQAQYICVERKGGETLELRAQSSSVSMNNWSVLQPQLYEGSTEAVQKLSENIAKVALDRFVATAQELGGYGLDDPAYTVCIQDALGTQRKFMVGDEIAEDTAMRYVRVEGSDDIYAAKKTLLTFLDGARLVSVVDRFTAIVNIVYVDKVQLRAPGASYALHIEREEQKEADGQIKLLANGEPDYAQTFFIDGARVAENAFKKVYQSMIGITMQGEVEGEVSGAGTYAMQYTFNNENEDMHLAFVPYRQDFYAYHQGQGAPLFYVRKEAVEQLPALIESAKALPSPEGAERVTHISIGMPDGQTREFAMQAGKETYRGKPLQAGQMAMAYQRLQEVTLTDVGRQSLEQKELLFTVTYTFDDGRPAQEVLFYEGANSGEYWMTMRGQGAQFVLNRSSFETQLENFDKWVGWTEAE